MDRFATFELRRLSDDLIYRFHKKQIGDGSVGYQREDTDLWILFKPDWGWVAWDQDTDTLSGRPWSVLATLQKDHPPEGEWVSKKGAKSYVYHLIYLQ